MALRRGHGGNRGVSGRGRGLGVSFLQGAESLSLTDPKLESGAAAFDANTELDALKNQVGSLETALSGIQQRIKELDARQPDEKAE